MSRPKEKTQIFFTTGFLSFLQIELDEVSMSDVLIAAAQPFYAENVLF